MLATNRGEQRRAGRSRPGTADTERDVAEARFAIELDVALDAAAVEDELGARGDDEFAGRRRRDVVGRAVEQAQARAPPRRPGCCASVPAG
jgi:hypothetical protein